MSRSKHRESSELGGRSRALCGARAPRCLQGVAALALLLSVGCKDGGGGGGDDDPDAGGLIGGPEAGTDNDAQTPGEDSGTPGNDAGGMDAGSDAGNDAGSDAGPGGDAGAGWTASTASIDFGLAPCGGAAPASQTVTFTNSSTVAISYTASLASTSAFSIAGATDGVLTGTIEAGATGMLTLDAAGIGTSASAGQAITTMLMVSTTNLPAPNNTIAIPVSVTPQGAHLALTPAGGPDWTLVQRGQDATPLSVTLLNTGNLPAEVTVTQPAAPEFGLRFGDALATTLSVPASAGGTAGSALLSATFSPTVAKPYTSSAGLSVTGPVCNGTTPSITSIPFEGAATGAGFTAVATAPLPSRVDCGATGSALPTAGITVGNYSGASMDVVVSMLNAGNSPFDLSDTMLTIESGMTATFTATLKASGVSTATPGTVLSDFVVLTPPVSSGLSQLSAALSTTVQGATLTFGAVSPFNGATGETAQTQSIAVINTGNLPVSPALSLAGTNADRFSFVTPETPLAPSVVEASGQSSVAVSFLPPVGDAETKTATLVLTPGQGDVICGMLPAPLPLSGTANTPGFELQTPLAGTVFFGDDGNVDCPPGNVAPPANFSAPSPVRSVTFKNTGVDPLEWTAVVDSGAFTLNALTGTVAAGQTGQIDITPDPITYPAVTTQNAYGGSLTITTNIVGDSAHVIPLVQSARGAILSLSPYTTTLGDVNVVGQSPITPFFALNNTGNLSASVTLTADVAGTTGSAEYAVFGTTASASAPALLTETIAVGSKDYSVSFDPADESIYDPMLDLVQSTLTASAVTSDPMCDAVLPLEVLLDARGTSDAVTYNIGANLDLPTQACNTQTNPPTSVVVSNFGVDPLDITGVSLDMGGTSWFSAYIGFTNNTMATVPPVMNGTPGSATITIAPKFISTVLGQPVNGTSVSGTLTISAEINATPLPDKVITISQPVSCP